MRLIRENKIWMSVILFLILTTMAVLLTRQIVVSADDKPSIGDGSFAKIAMANADALNEYVALGSSKVNLGGLITEAMTAGGFLGYTESGGTLHEGAANTGLREEGVQLTVTASNTAGEVNYPYAALSALGDPFRNYVMYGRLLRGCGIDQTLENGFSDNSRKWIGIALMALFVLVNFVDSFWTFVLDILKYVNPFILFAKQPGLEGNLDLIAGSPTYGATSIQNAITKIQETIGGFYTLLQDNAFMLFLPLCLIFALFVWLVVHKGQNFGKTVKGFAIRLIFSSIGVLVLCCVYTTGLKLVTDMTLSTGDSAVQAVYSTFFDFERLVYDYRLSINSSAVNGNPTSGSGGIEYSSGTDFNTYFESGAVKSTVLSQVRGYASAFNMQTPTFDKDPVLGDHGTGEFADKLLSRIGTDNKENSIYKKDVAVSLLERFASGSKVSAAAYESYAKSKYGTLTEELAKEYGISEKWIYFSEDHSEATKLNVVYGNEVELAYTDGDTRKAGYKIWEAQATLPSGASYATMCDIAVYNYLSSVFDESKVTVYSASTNSGLAKAEHFSVNVVGDPTMQVMYLLDLATLLICMMVIGYVYGFGLIIANFKAMIKIIPAVFTGMVGSLRGIATACILVAALVIEILGTCVIYNLGIMLVASIYKLIEFPFAEILHSVLGDNVGGVFAIVTGVVSCLIMLFIISKLITYRYAICTALTDQAADIINKFFGTQVANPGLSETNAASVLGGAAVVGVGVANAAGINKEALSNEANALGDKLGISGSNVNDGSTSDGSSGLADSEAEKNVTGNTGERDSAKADNAEDYVASEGGDEWSADSNDPNSSENKGVSYNGSGASDVVSEDTNGNITVRDAEGNSTTYDKDGNVVATTGTGASHVLGHDASGNAVVSSYDEDGNLVVSSYDENGNPVTTKYAASGKPVVRGYGANGAIVADENGEQMNPYATTSGAGNKFASDVTIDDNSEYVISGSDGKTYNVIGKDANGNVVVQDQTNGHIHPIIDSNGQVVTAENFDVNKADTYSIGASGDSGGKLIPVSSARANMNYVPADANADYIMSDSNGNKYLVTQNADGSYSATGVADGRNYELVDNFGYTASGSLSENQSYSLVGKDSNGNPVANSVTSIDTKASFMAGTDKSDLMVTSLDTPTMTPTSGNIITMSDGNGRSYAVLTETGQTYTQADLDSGKVMTIVETSGQGTGDYSSAIKVSPDMIQSGPNGQMTITGLGGSTLQVNSVSSSAFDAAGNAGLSYGSVMRGGYGQGNQMSVGMTGTTPFVNMPGGEKLSVAPGANGTIVLTTSDGKALSYVDGPGNTGYYATAGGEKLPVIVGPNNAQTLITPTGEFISYSGAKPVVTTAVGDQVSFVNGQPTTGGTAQMHVANYATNSNNVNLIQSATKDAALGAALGTMAGAAVYTTMVAYTSGDATRGGAYAPAGNVTRGDATRSGAYAPAGYGGYQGTIGAAPVQAAYIVNNSNVQHVPSSVPAAQVMPAAGDVIRTANPTGNTVYVYRDGSGNGFVPNARPAAVVTDTVTEKTSGAKSGEGDININIDVNIGAKGATVQAGSSGQGETGTNALNEGIGNLMNSLLGGARAVGAATKGQMKINAADAKSAARDGKNGKNGTDGTKGKDGKNGKDGIDGKSGQNGRNGKGRRRNSGGSAE